jgi:hypothetical protein
MHPRPLRRAAAVLRRTRAGVARFARAAAGLLPRRRTGPAGRTLTDYKAPNYWLGYRSGFVRRGLPGEVLRRLVGGTPTFAQAQAAATGLSRAAALSIVPVVLQVVRRAPGWRARTVAAALLLLSPLTGPLLLDDVGRYDAVGVLVLALTAASRSVWLRLPAPVGVLLLATAVAAAVASEEFLLAVVAPAAVAATALLDRRSQASARRLLLTGLALGPGALVAGASLLQAAPRAALLAAREEAARAGVGVDPMGDALTALDRSLVENLAYFRLFEPMAIARSLALWAGLYALTTRALERLVGAGRPYRLLVGVHAAVGAVLCVVAADFRRWWGLALMGLLAALALQEPTWSDHQVTAATLTGAAALALAGLTLRSRRVFPGGPLRLDRSPPKTL